jgi:hypothetical protein
VEIINDQVILVAHAQELQKLERTKIPDDLEIEAKPVVAIIGAGAGKYILKIYIHHITQGRSSKMDVSIEETPKPDIQARKLGCQLPLSFLST